MKEIAYVPWDTLQVFGMEAPKAFWVVGSTFLLNILVVSLFFKQFKIAAFTTVASFDSVGSILVVGMLIIPAATAYLLTEKLNRMIVISMGIEVLSTLMGYYTAVMLDASIAGCMVSIAGVIFGLAFLFSSSQGLVTTYMKRRRLSIER